MLGELENRGSVVGGTGALVGDAGGLEPRRDLEGVRGVVTQRVVCFQEGVDAAGKVGTLARAGEAPSVVPRRRSRGLERRPHGPRHELVERTGSAHVVAWRG